MHADYQTSYFRSLEYLRERVAGEQRLNILGILQNPTPGDLEQALLPGFSLVGFDVMDVAGDVSALTNCGGFDDVFAKAELSHLGLLTDPDRAYQVQRDLQRAYPHERHAKCHVWALWRLGGSSEAAA
jgi:hypothetical protein